MYAFAQAPTLGWDGPADQAVEHAAAFLDHYRRPDGLVRTLATADGAPLDEGVVLYDQAFALLGYAAAFTLSGRASFEDQAKTLRRVLTDGWKMPAGGFRSRLATAAPLQSNPHMHLFEACLAWIEAGGDGAWRGMADEIATLAMDRFIDPSSGGLRESFDETWAPTTGLEGALLEPGHQFEWGWLLLRWSKIAARPEAEAAALRLIALGERIGVDKTRRVAMAQVLPDGTVIDGVGRLWSQTERLKAGVLAAETTGEPVWWEVALEAGETLLIYLDTELPGLWRDRMDLSGAFISEPAPGSSLYHIVCAIAELDRPVTAAGS